MTASFVLNNQLRFQGSAAYGMVGIAAGAVLNVGLDPLLIFGLNMGVAGAALATILSQLASFCMLLLGCARGGNLRIRLKNLCFRRDLFVEIGKGGLPSLCRQGLASIATICLNRSAGLYGDAAIAAMSVVSRAMMLAQSALIGFGQGFQPVCGFNYGAGLYHRVKEGFRFCVKWSTVFLTAVSVLGLVLAPQIIAVFRNDPEVIAFGARALRLQCLVFPLCGVIVISSMLTQTINKVWQASVLAAARQGLFFIPAVLALPHIWGELGVQLAQPVSDVCAFALTVPLVLGVLRDMDRQQRLEKSDKKTGSGPHSLAVCLFHTLQGGSADDTSVVAQPGCGDDGDGPILTAEAVPLHIPAHRGQQALPLSADAAADEDHLRSQGVDDVGHSRPQIVAEAVHHGVGGLVSPVRRVKHGLSGDLLRPRQQGLRMLRRRLPGLTDQGRGGGIRLPAAPAAAGAGLAVQHQQGVAQLGPGPPHTVINFPADDDAAANAGAQGNEHHVVVAHRRTRHLFGQSGTVGVVAETAGNAKALLQHPAHRDVVPSQVIRSLHHAVGRVAGAR